MSLTPTIKLPIEFDIIDMEGSFAILFKGETIAEIAQWEKWEQTSGETLPEPIFNALVNKIESFYE